MNNSTLSNIDIARLPAPDVVEKLSYSEILQQMKDQLTGLSPLLLDGQTGQPVIATAERIDAGNGDIYFKVPATVAASLQYVQLASDPTVKLLEVAAYREHLQRARVNDASLAVLLPFAKGADLDQVGARYKVSRLQLTAGDAAAVPPVLPTYEDDDSFRRRIWLAFEGFSTAGPEAAYLFHSLSADAQVKDASVVGPPTVGDGEVLVTVLSRQGNGSADSALTAKVDTALNAENKRPLTDKVTVQGAAIIDYSVVAELIFYPGPDAAIAMAEANKQLQAYIDQRHKLGNDITISGLHGALHQEGVQEVKLTSPAANIEVNYNQAAHCSTITITNGGVDE